MIIPSEK